MKPVDAVKYDFAGLDKSNVRAYFGIFGKNKILMGGKNQWFDLSIDFHKFQVLGRDQDGRHEASNYGEIRVWVWKWNTIS